MKSIKWNIDTLINNIDENARETTRTKTVNFIINPALSYKISLNVKLTLLHPRGNDRGAARILPKKI